MIYTIKRTNRKTLAISIVDGQVIVRSPLYLQDKIINDFVLSKQSWIEEKLLSYKAPGIKLNQMKLRYYGQNLSMEVIEAKKFELIISDTIKIYRPKTMQDERLIYHVETALKRDLFQYLDKKVEYYANLLGIEKPPFTIRRYKRMYGRCNKKGELGFNLYLFHDMPRFINYVVLHECAHILEFNHSARFYAIIERFMPDYKQVIALNKL